MKDRMKWLLAFLLVFMMTAGMLSGCGQDPGVSDQEGPTEENTVVLAAARDQALDAFGVVNGCLKLCGVWESLVSTEVNGTLRPELAESWENNEDYTEWTFHLMQGVSFSDGVPFNADAVILNYERFSHGTDGLDWSKYYPTMQEVRKDDEYTVTLCFEEPQPTLLYNIADYNSVMLSPDCFDSETGLIEDLPVGTGRFLIYENVPDQYCLLQRNDSYYGEPAKAEYVKIRTIPDANTRYSALKSGEIAGVVDLGAIQPLMARELCQDSNFEAFTNGGTLVHNLMLNLQHAPFDDVRMRQAVSLAVDRENIIHQLYNDYGTPSVNVVSKNSPFHIDLPVEHDLEKAKALAREVLGDERASMVFLVNTKEISRYPYKEQAEYVQSVLAELGIDTEIQIYDDDTIEEMLNAGQYDVIMADRSMPSGDAIGILEGFLSSEGSYNKRFSLGFHSDKADELIAEAKVEVDMDKRFAMYEELQRLFVEEKPVITLFDDPALYAYNKSMVTGMGTSPAGEVLKNVELVK